MSFVRVACPQKGRNVFAKNLTETGLIGEVLYIYRYYVKPETIVTQKASLCQISIHKIVRLTKMRPFKMARVCDDFDSLKECCTHSPDLL